MAGGDLLNIVSDQPLEDMETKVTHMSGQLFDGTSPQENPGYQGSGELPWLAGFCAYCHPSVTGRSKRSPLGQDDREFCLWSLLNLAQAPEPFADFSSSPFAVIKP